MNREQARQQAQKYAQEHGHDIPPALIFEATNGWVFSTGVTGGVVGGFFAVLVERDTGSISAFGSCPLFHRILHPGGKTGLLCPEAAAKSVALMDRILALSGATIEDIAGAQSVFGDHDVLMVGQQDQVQELAATLRQEGFQVYLKDMSAIGAKG